MTYLYIFLHASHWLYVLCLLQVLSGSLNYVLFVIGQSDNFAFGFMTFNWHPLSKDNVNEELILTASYPKDR